MTDVTENQSELPKKKSLLRRLSPAIVILLALALVVGIAKMPGRPKPSGQQPIPPVNVQVMKVQPIAQMPDLFELPGVVTVNSTVTVAAEVDGRVEKKLVEEGQTVKKGQPLLRLNTDLLQADYDKALADSTFNRADLVRVQKLAESKIASTQEAEAAAMKSAVSDAALKQATARLERAEIHAPMDGILDSLPVEEGTYVLPGACVAKVVDIATVKVVVDVPEHDVVKISPGDEVMLTNSSTTHKGKITYISQLADEKTRTSRVEITVDNSRRLLRSGQIIRARLSRGVVSDAIMIPLLAVIPLENGKEVFCFRDGKAIAKRVTLGPIKGDKVQVMPCEGGLCEGDLLIVSGQRYVSDGQAVAIAADAPATASAPASAAAPAAGSTTHQKSK